MADFTTTERELYRLHARPIVHMRSQMKLNRFGLVFGSGLSKAFGLPIWSELIRAIASDPKVKGKTLLKKFSGSKSFPYQTELLLQHFKRRRHHRASPNGKAFEYETLAAWLKIVTKHLYANTPEDFEAKVINHPYLQSFLPIIRRTAMTVTYNFDNFLERALTLNKKADDDRSRGYEVVTNPWAQFRRTDSVIYHANGYFPPELMEVPADKFVFSEAAYAEQFARIFAGDQSALVNHFTKNTCLLLGLSLEDEILRNLLILSAKAAPGNYHYYIYYVEREGQLTEAQQEAIRKTNFNVYNLITIFLTDNQIASIGSLINSDKVLDQEIRDLAEQIGAEKTFVYYLTGPLGVGKSTAVNNFRNLLVFDEWVEERFDKLGVPPEQLPGDQISLIDEWVVSQFKKKDENLRHGAPGIFIVDRPPLDPIVFTPPDKIKEKACKLLTSMCPGCAPWRVQKGTIILLIGDKEELAVRMLLTDRKKYNAEKLGKMQEKMKVIYNAEGVITLDTRGLSISEVSKQVADIIHLQQYEPCEIHSRLEAFRDGTAVVSIENQ